MNAIHHTLNLATKAGVALRPPLPKLPENVVEVAFEATEQTWRSLPKSLRIPGAKPTGVRLRLTPGEPSPQIKPPPGMPVGTPSQSTITPSRAHQLPPPRPLALEGEPPTQESVTPTSAIIYPRQLPTVTQTGALSHAGLAEMNAALIVQYQGGKLEQVIPLTDKMKGGSECAAVYSTMKGNQPLPWVLKAFVADGAAARSLPDFYRKQARYLRVQATERQLRQTAPDTPSILLPQSRYLRAASHPLLLQFQQRMRGGPDHRLTAGDWEHVLATLRHNHPVQHDDQTLRLYALSALNQKINLHLTRHPVLQALPENAKQPLPKLIPGASEPQMADLKYHNVELRLKRDPHGQIMLDQDGLPEFEGVRLADVFGGNVGVPNAWYLAQDWEGRWLDLWRRYRIAPTIDAADGGATPIDATPT